MLRSYKNTKIGDKYSKFGVENDMTYILGSRCKNGVVIIGDTKITAEGGTQFIYGNKILRPLDNIVIGSAGSEGLYSEFQDRLYTVIRITLEDYGSDHPYLKTEEGFKILITDVIRQMHDTYGKDSYQIEDNLQILCASRITPKASLTLFTGGGNQLPIKDYMAIGHGRYSASIFHKNLLHKTINMSMEEVAKVGLFIIQSFQKMELDQSVGYNDEYLPQIFFIPDINLPEDFPRNLSPHLPEIEKSKLQVRYAKHEEENPIQELEQTEICELMKGIEPVEEGFRKYIKDILTTLNKGK